MTNLPRFPDAARLYLRPAALLSAAHEGPDAWRMAGTSLAFASAEVIVSDAGERLYSSLHPVAALSRLAGELPKSLSTQMEQTLGRIREARAPLPLPSGAELKLSRPLIMGVINVTPDSFSDGGRFSSSEAAIEQAGKLAAEGADILDIGGESTRPGATTVWEGEEKDRVLPVIEGIRELGLPVSVDTRRASVMRAAIDAGAGIINDISALTADEESLEVASKAGTPVVLMHSLGDPQTMQDNPRYDDVLLDVFDFLEERIAAAEEAGIERRRIIVDPGIGFGKTVRHNAVLINGLSIFHGLGCPLLLGASRKRFIAALSREETVERRLAGSLVAGLKGISQGVQILRVHDVEETRQALAVTRGLLDVTFLPPSAD